MKDFLTALNGGRGEFDDWLECYSEKEIRDLLIPFVKQRDELLAALKEVRKWIGDGEFSDDTNWKFWSKAYSDIIHHVDEVIAKSDLTQ